MTPTARGERATEGFYRCPIEGCDATFFALVDLEDHAIEEHAVLRDVLPEPT